MPWFRVCDTFAFDEKAVAVGNAALGLWTRAGSWCAQQLTDGFVPTHMVAALGGSPSQVRKLVQAGLWEATDGGYRFVGWVETQPTRRDIEAERAAARDRMRRHRAGNARSGEHTPNVRANFAGTNKKTNKKPEKNPDVDQTVTTTAPQPAAGNPAASMQVSGLRSEHVRPNTTRTSPAVTPTHTRPSPTSSPSPPHDRDGPTTKTGGGDSRSDHDPAAAAAIEVVTALGPPWRLGPQAVERLKPALTKALRAGWTVDNLAAHLRASPDGVRNSYAVLAARLADLPTPPTTRPKRPQWCGICDETTRMRETDDRRPYRCPTCHPGANMAKAARDRDDAQGAA